MTTKNNSQDFKYITFKIQIDRNWIEVLEELIKVVLQDSHSSPEGALEAMIFQQIKEQIEK